jgi:hypothetical protein
MDAEIGAEIEAAWDPEMPSWTAWRACFHVYLDAVLRPDRCRILFQEGPAILGMKSVDILMDLGAVRWWRLRDCRTPRSAASLPSRCRGDGASP